MTFKIGTDLKKLGIIREKSDPQSFQKQQIHTETCALFQGDA